MATLGAPSTPDPTSRLCRLECTAELLDAERTERVFRRLSDDDGVARDGEPLEGDLFALRIRAASTVQVDGEVLTVTLWSPDGGVRTVERT